MSAFQGEEGQSQSSPSSSPSSSRTPGGSVKANPKDATAVLGLDLPAEKRKEEAKLTELSTSSRTLMAQAKERQKATRKAADKLAEELKKARVEGGEAQRSLTVKLGEAELEVQTLKRYLREAESIGASPGLSSPAGAVKVGASALTPGSSLAAASMSEASDLATLQMKVSSTGERFSKVSPLPAGRSCPPMRFSTPVSLNRAR